MIGPIFVNTVSVIVFVLANNLSDPPKRTQIEVLKDRVLRRTLQSQIRRDNIREKYVVMSFISNACR
jgi:hypothetical protein